MVQTTHESLVIAKGWPFQEHMQLEAECDPEWYENKVQTTKKIHLLNFLGENNFKGVQKPS